MYVPHEHGGGHYETRRIKKRLVQKQYLIITRAAAKTMYLEFLQAYFLVVYTTTTRQVTTAPTMNQAEEVLAPLRTALARAKGPVLKFMTEGSPAEYHRVEGGSGEAGQHKEGHRELCLQQPVGGAAYDH